MTYSEAFSLWVAEVYRNHGYEPDKECVPLSRILRESECNTIEPSPSWRRLFFVYRQIPVSGNFSLNVA